MELKILCFGSFTIDVFVKTAIDIGFNKNRTHYGSDCIQMNFGGCASNISYGLRKIGVASDMCGSLTDEDYLQHLRDADVVIVGNSKDKEIDKYVVISEKKSQRLTFFNRGKGDNSFVLTENDLGRYTDIVISSEARSNMLKVKKMASRLGKFCHIDVGGEIYNLTKNDVLSLIIGARTVFLNDKELSYAEHLGISIEDIRIAVDFVVITYGSQGAKLMMRDEVYYESSPSVDYVDETGCGDAFRAGFLNALYRDVPNWKDKDPNRWLKDGHEMAAKCISVVGGQSYLG